MKEYQLNREGREKLT